MTRELRSLRTYLFLFLAGLLIGMLVMNVAGSELSKKAIQLQTDVTERVLRLSQVADYMKQAHHYKNGDVTKGYMEVVTTQTISLLEGWEQNDNIKKVLTEGLHFLRTESEEEFWRFIESDYRPVVIAYSHGEQEMMKSSLLSEMNVPAVAWWIKVISFAILLTCLSFWIWPDQSSGRIKR